MKNIIAFTLAAAALTACAPQPGTLTGAPSGKTQKIDRYFSINENCSTIGRAEVTITSQPANGTVSLVRGSDYPNFPMSNPRSDCNTRTVPALLVYYRSNPGYVGNDSFSYDVIYGSGRFISVTKSIAVR